MNKTGHSKTRLKYNGQQYIVRFSFNIATEVEVRYWHPKLMWVERTLWHRPQPLRQKIEAIIKAAHEKREQAAAPSAGRMGVDRG